MASPDSAAGAAAPPQAPSRVAAELAAALEGHVRFLAGLEPGRSAAAPASLDAARDYVRRALARAGGETFLQPVPVEGRVFHNVVSRFGPASAERLVVGAHYDAAGDTPGADDNASGTAVLIELARRLAHLPLDLRVELVAYTLEEPPHFGTEHMGSVHHAQRSREDGARLVGMICLEMVGYFRPEEGTQRFPVPAMSALYPSTGDFLAVVGRPEDAVLAERVHSALDAAGGLPVERLLAPRTVAGIDFSDHRSYCDAGFSAVMLTDTAFFRNPHYHAVTDTPDTLDYAAMAAVVEGVLAVVRELAGAERASGRATRRGRR